MACAYIWRGLGSKAVAVRPYVPPTATATATATPSKKSDCDLFWTIFGSVFGFLNLVLLVVIIYLAVAATN